MSSREKKHHRYHVVGTSKDEAVRLFAFANTRPVYHVVFSPERPLIVLKTKKASSEHPCKQWAPLASLVFAQRPNTTHALYVADTTALPESVEREESVAPIAGPLVRRLANAIARLNPHDATMVAAGVSSSIALKYVIGGEKTMGHRDRLVLNLIIVCPPSPRQLQSIVQAAKKQTVPKDYPPPRLVIILSDASQEGIWRECLQEATAARLISSWSLTLDIKPSLFAAIAREACVQPDNTAVDTHTRFTEPRLYRIDFVLSKDTKKTEQWVTPSSLYSGDCYGEEYDSSNDEDNRKNACEPRVDPTSATSCAEEGDDASSCCDSHTGNATPMLVSGLTSLQHCHHPTRVAVEGRVMDGGIIGTTQGSVVVRGIPKTLDVGLAVRAECGIERKPCGQTILVARRVTRLTRKEERNSMTVCRPAEVPAHNVSAISHAYGALLVRGRKCVLVCSLQGTENENDMNYISTGDTDCPQIPMTRHSESLESATDCAVRAVCDCCDVSPDTFYLPSYCPPACYYTTDAAGARVCVTLYLALAVAPPPGGPASDAAEEPEEPGEPYNWYGFARARAALATEPERAALDDLCRSLRRARDAGLYVPPPGVGLFGDALRAEARGATGSLCGVELMVIVAPGAAAGVADARLPWPSLRVGSETVRGEIAAAAQAAQAAGAATLALCLAPDVDVMDFCDHELTHWTKVCGATARIVALLFPGAAMQMAWQRDDAAADGLDAFIAVVPLADALVVTSDTAESFTPETWAMLRLATCLNPNLTLGAGVSRCRPVVLPPAAAGTDEAEEEEGEEAMALRKVLLCRDARPVVGRRFAPLLERDGLRQCCGDSCALLWAEGDVWLASRPEVRGLLSFDAVDCCLALEEGEVWEAEEPRATTVTLHVWATRSARDSLERAVGAVFDKMLCESANPSEEELDDDLLPRE